MSVLCCKAGGIIWRLGVKKEKSALCIKKDNMIYGVVLSPTKPTAYNFNLCVKINNQRMWFIYQPDGIINYTYRYVSQGTSEYRVIAIIDQRIIPTNFPQLINDVNYDSYKGLYYFCFSSRDEYSIAVSFDGITYAKRNFSLNELYNITHAYYDEQTWTAFTFRSIGGDNAGNIILLIEAGRYHTSYGHEQDFIYALKFSDINSTPTSTLVRSSNDLISVTDADKDSVGMEHINQNVGIYDRRNNVTYYIEECTRLVPSGGNYHTEYNICLKNFPGEPALGEWSVWQPRSFFSVQVN